MKHSWIVNLGFAVFLVAFSVLALAVANAIYVDTTLEQIQSCRGE
jgi:hypothetical protein